MALKDWKKSKKYNKKHYTMYFNILPQYENFAVNYYLTIGEIGKTNEYYVSVTKLRKQIVIKEFEKHSQALKFAKNYMRTH